jgi:hypothetical protein
MSTPFAFAAALDRIKKLRTGNAEPEALVSALDDAIQLSSGDTRALLSDALGQRRMGRRAARELDAAIKAGDRDAWQSLLKEQK